MRGEGLEDGAVGAGRSWSGRLLAGQTRVGQLWTTRSAVNGMIDAPAVGAGGSTSLLLALLSAASRAGSWCAVVGMPSLGALAAAESGIALDRLALVPNPGPEWPTVVAALIDGVDVVVVAVPGPVAPTIASRLVARVRQRGCVLMPYGNWAGADVTLQVVRGRWEGLGVGHGRLRRREVTIVARGRGAAARPKELTMWMPGATALPPIPPPAGRIPAGPAAVAAPAGPSTPGRAVVGSASAVVGSASAVVGSASVAFGTVVSAPAASEAVVLASAGLGSAGLVTSGCAVAGSVSAAFEAVALAPAVTGLVSVAPAVAGLVSVAPAVSGEAASGEASASGRGFAAVGLVMGVSLGGVEAGVSEGVASVGSAVDGPVGAGGAGIGQGGDTAVGRAAVRLRRGALSVVRSA